MNNTGPAPALRVCDACGQVDDHPRHVIGGGDPGTADAVSRADGQTAVDLLLDQGYDTDTVRLAMRQLAEPGLYLHLDCCRDLGCPDGTCGRLTAGVEELRGDELRAHLMSLGQNTSED